MKRFMVRFSQNASCRLLVTDQVPIYRWKGREYESDYDPRELEEVVKGGRTVMQHPTLPRCCVFVSEFDIDLTDPSDTVEDMIVGPPKTDDVRDRYIREALDMLDRDAPDQWTGNGLPQVPVVREYASRLASGEIAPAIKRADIDRLAPNLRREEPLETD